TTPQLQPYYHFYDSGKSAVNLKREKLETAGVHRFQSKSRNLTSTIVRPECVLHYACCGFEHFWTKYATLGAFGDAWWGKIDIAQSIGPFHLDARNVVATGDRDRARAFYRERQALYDREKAQDLIVAGLARRDVLPRQIVRLAREQSKRKT